MLIIVLRHVFNFISEILFIMQNNDVEFRLPCQEGALGKASQLALVKIRKSMTKSNRRVKGSFLKAAEKKTEVKVGNYFKGEGAISSYGAQKSCKRKEGNFLKERNSFLMTHEEQRVVINQKRQLLTKGGCNF